MKRGFTIIELLVASLLLGMLMTILTMVFNQSSIAWRLGTAGVADLDDVRDNMAELRDEADNAFIYKLQGNYELHRTVGLWDTQGKLRDRACDAKGSQVYGDTKLRANFLIDKLGSSLGASTRLRDLRPLNVGQMGSGNNANVYSVNVMSAGPDREFDTWDDIWSSPDDFD